MKVDAYLERIGCKGSRGATVETLRRLHRSHLLTVPFENLDIVLGRRIIPSIESSYDKIVRRRRGGFCYELNGLFSWLLRELGFRVTLLSARVCDGPQPGPEFDHLTLLVGLEKKAQLTLSPTAEPPTNVLADVGFGESFFEPLPIDAMTGDADATAYRVTGTDPELVVERRRDGRWERQYIFSLMARRLSEFGGMCNYHQTSPLSHFTRTIICSMATSTGRVTLSGRRAIVTTAVGREEREIADGEEYQALLRDWFGIDLTDETLLKKVFA
jgi:N-hydroxyarylamine O-acetyltransferase